MIELPEIKPREIALHKKDILQFQFLPGVFGMLDQVPALLNTKKISPGPVTGCCKTKIAGPASNVQDFRTFIFPDKVANRPAGYVRGCPMPRGQFPDIPRVKILQMFFLNLVIPEIMERTGHEVHVIKCGDCSLVISMGKIIRNRNPLE